MKVHEVVFLPYDKKITVVDGENLMRAAMAAGVHINASCGGEGICGKCRVMVEAGRVEDGVSEQLDARDLAKGYRQACMISVHDDLILRIPTPSTRDAGALKRSSFPRHAARAMEIDLEDLKEKGLFVPPVEKRYVELPEPTAQDNLPDVTRLISFLKLNFDEHRLEVDLSVIRKIPDVLRKDGFKVTATLARPVRDTGKTRIINIQPGDTTDRNFAIAIDVGTSTIHGRLIDLVAGRVMAQHLDFNGQLDYGRDVISRIVYAQRAGGLEKLQKVVVLSINRIIERMIGQAGVDPDDISTITLAGNTTMTQLMLKINPRYIRRPPYVPASTLYPPFKAADLGLNLGDHVTALVYPEVSSHVGGDIVAGIMGSGIYLADELTLYLDVGTNAEIVIGNKDWLACAACSAGPAFEGGGIQYGMQPTAGAIQDFSIDPETCEPMNLTIGSVRPKGICGSGLITLVATLFENGVIDNLGKFNRDLQSARLRSNGRTHEYVVAWQNETQIDRDIVLTEGDIENLIRAKGAIYSGCMTLLEEVGLSVRGIDRIFLAGGFGPYVDLEKAMTIGLLPEIDPERVTFIGNGSLMGAKMSSLSNHIRKDVVEVTRKMTNFELSETASYMDNYVAALFLPHTDLGQFPRLRARLAVCDDRS